MSTTADRDTDLENALAELQSVAEGHVTNKAGTPTERVRAAVSRVRNALADNPDWAVVPQSTLN